MASGHANRANRPNTWLHRPATRREVLTCQPGAVHTWHKAAILSPRAEPRLHSVSPRPSEGGVLMRRREAGRGAEPAGLVAPRHSGGIALRPIASQSPPRPRMPSGDGPELPPGPTRSPCRELADRPAIAGNGKRGPMPETLPLARRKAPAALRKDRGHHRFALFGAPSPH
jgi:hypothetical protein